MSVLITKAVELAHKAHAGQVRKYTGGPYFSHCAEVASIIARTDPFGTEFSKDTLIAAAYLHDILEDTEVTKEELGLEFGPQVLDLVMLLSDFQTPEDGNRAFRKAKHANRVLTSEGSRLIKLADILSNAKSICNHDKAFAKVFIGEALALMGFYPEKEKEHGFFRYAQSVLEYYSFFVFAPSIGSKQS